MDITVNKDVYDDGLLALNELSLIKGYVAEDLVAATVSNTADRVHEEQSALREEAESHAQQAMTLLYQLRDAVKIARKEERRKHEDAMAKARSCFERLYGNTGLCDRVLPGLQATNIEFKNMMESIGYDVSKVRTA